VCWWVCAFRQQLRRAKPTSCQRYAFMRFDRGNRYAGPSPPRVQFLRQQGKVKEGVATGGMRMGEATESVASNGNASVRRPRVRRLRACPRRYRRQVEQKCYEGRSGIKVWKEKVMSVGRGYRKSRMWAPRAGGGGQVLYSGRYAPTVDGGGRLHVNRRQVVMA